MEMSTVSRSSVICLRCVKIEQLKAKYRADIEALRKDRAHRPYGTPGFVLVSSRIRALDNKLMEVKQLHDQHRKVGCP
jgi:hypothetical protein